MTPQQAAQLLNSPIFKAYSEGKKVEFCHDGKYWMPVTDLPYQLSFNTLLKEPKLFRIKPEPREFWIIKGKDKYSHKLSPNVYVNKELAEEVLKECANPNDWEILYVKEILPS